MSRPYFLEAAKSALKKYYPRYQCAFVAGSMLRGEDTATSDIDIVVFYDDEFEEVHRYSAIDSGWPIEFFVHNRKSHDYYMDKDRQRGMCVIMDMVAKGIALPEDNDMAKERRTKAQEIIDSGPPALSDAELEDRRYFITDSIDDLDENKPALERFGTLAKLYDQLGDLYLRGQGLWSGHGKSLGRLLRQNDPIFAEKYEASFASAFQGDFDEVRLLAESLLSEYGGRYFDGYDRPAPKDAWKNFKPEESS